MEREAVIAAVREIRRKTQPPGAVTSFWAAVLVVAAWLGLAALALGALAAAGSVREADLVRRSLAFPAVLVWLTSAFGLVCGLLALVRPKGRKGLAALAALANGVLCAAPVVALLVWVK